MTSLPIQVYFALSISLLAVGFYILSVKRNILRIILAIELMITGANMAFVILGYWIGNGVVDPLIRSIVIISMGIASIVAALAIAFVILIFNKFGTRDIRKLRKLRW